MRVGLGSRLFVCLFVGLMSKSTFVSVMSGRSHRFLGINQFSGELMCLTQGHSTEIKIIIDDYLFPPQFLLWLFVLTAIIAYFYLFAFSKIFIFSSK